MHFGPAKTTAIGLVAIFANPALSLIGMGAIVPTVVGTLGAIAVVVGSGLYLLGK